MHLCHDVSKVLNAGCFLLLLYVFLSCRAKEGMYLVGSSTALYAAAEKAMAAGRPCMWAPVLDHLNAEGCVGKSLQVGGTQHSTAQHGMTWLLFQPWFLQSGSALI
jgi:hypothetical protein